jgi:hypothetical protein
MGEGFVRYGNAEKRAKGLPAGLSDEIQDEEFLRLRSEVASHVFFVQIFYVAESLCAEVQGSVHAGKDEVIERLASMLDVLPEVVSTDESQSSVGRVVTMNLLFGNSLSSWA